MSVFTIIVYLLVPLTSAVTLEQTVTLSQCRAQCAARYIREITSRRDQHCVRSGECLECWKTCHHLTLKPQNHERKFEEADPVCSRGCQTSCDFMKTLAQDQKTPNVEKYTLITDVTINNKTFFVINVHLNIMAEDSGRLVYSLLLKHKTSSQWRYYSSSMDNRLFVLGTYSMYEDFQFKVMALPLEGIVGIKELQYKDLSEKVVSKTTTEEALSGEVSTEEMTTAFSEYTSTESDVSTEGSPGDSTTVSSTAGLGSTEGREQSSPYSEKAIHSAEGGSQCTLILFIVLSLLVCSLTVIVIVLLWFHLRLLRIIRKQSRFHQLRRNRPIYKGGQEGKSNHSKQKHECRVMLYEEPDVQNLPSVSTVVPNVHLDMC